ncbi:CpsD/CapB family tyrosine-protein kinase [Bacillus testis]|uniref:CpsD/CapB family tyrosine-protein kinase n=1 Tax=Bacillus testis TaxID=1622072 RepID=UPI00067F2483|nr:CpsD/CapB family tyrosine-protein kinase [Bacillus testis]
MYKKKDKSQLNNKRSLVTKWNSKSPISEQYRTIRTNIQFSAVDAEIKTLLVTSSSAGEGKSTTAANLAVVFAQQGNKVLLVDADLRKPTIHHTFNVQNAIGLTSILTKKKELFEAISETEVKSLFVLSSGPIPPNPAELISSESMKVLLECLKVEFDTIIFDTPPILAVADAHILANRCDGSILVILSGHTENKNASKAKEVLESSSSNLLGAVLNKKKAKADEDYYYYSK